MPLPTNLRDTSLDVIAEVKTRLFRSNVPWLLVLDNLEDRSLLDKFIPHGAGSRGHVLITTRHVDVESGNEHFGSLALGCFSTNESLELLRRSVGAQNMQTSDESAAKELASRLGNLPLALGIAGAYMRKCDVTISEYLERYSDQSLLHDKMNDYALTVASSLSLSLDVVGAICPVACEVLSFLFPDTGGSVNTYSDEVKVALSGRSSPEEIDSALAASIGMTVKDARKAYRVHFHPALNGIPFSGEETTILVGAKIVGNVSYADLANGEHFEHSKSAPAIKGYMQSNIFTNHFNSRSDDEIVSAAQKFKPEVEESDIRAKLSQPMPEMAKLDIDLSDVPNQSYQQYQKEEGKDGSKYTGVTKHGGKWQAKIKIDKKDYALGSYATQEEAAQCYANAMWKYRLNKKSGSGVSTATADSKPVTKKSKQSAPAEVKPSRTRKEVNYCESP
ncbi:hypothetical protein ACHAXN_004948 [Cyclotella atomus]